MKRGIRSRYRSRSKNATDSAETKSSIIRWFSKYGDVILWAITANDRWNLGVFVDRPTPEFIGVFGRERVNPNDKSCEATTFRHSGIKKKKRTFENTVVKLFVLVETGGL